MRSRVRPQVGQLAAFIAAAASRRLINDSGRRKVAWIRSRAMDGAPWAKATGVKTSARGIAAANRSTTRSEPPVSESHSAVIQVRPVGGVLIVRMLRGTRRPG